MWGSALNRVPRTSADDSDGSTTSMEDIPWWPGATRRFRPFSQEYLSNSFGRPDVLIDGGSQYISEDAPYGFVAGVDAS
jgi:hypothetical protein